MLIYLSHPTPRDHDPDEYACAKPYAIEQLWKKIEAFVKENNYPYLTDRFIDDASETQDLVLKLPNLISEDSLENKRKIEILRSFLFDDLKLHRSCLHFYTDKFGVNGSGQTEKGFQSLDCLTTLVLLKGSVPTKEYQMLKKPKRKRRNKNS